MTKEDILEAGYQLFGSKGYDATSMDDIAKKAKTTKGGLYHHFSSKEELFADVAMLIHKKHNFEDLLTFKTITKAILKKRFLQMGEAVITAHKKDPLFSGLLLEIQQQARKSSKLRKLLLKKGQAKSDVVTALLQEAIDKGIFGKERDLEYIIYRLKSGIDIIGVYMGMNVTLFDYKRMWKKTVEDIFSK